MLKNQTFIIYCSMKTKISNLILNKVQIDLSHRKIICRELNFL